MLQMRHYIESYIDYQKNRISTNSLSAYTRDILQFEVYLQGITDWSSVTYNIIEDFLEFTFTSKRTANRKLSSIRSFFRYLVRKKVIENNPALVAERYKRVGISKHSSLSMHEIDKLRSSCEKNIVESTILEILFCSGIRVSELVGLNLHSLDSEKRELKVRGKGNKERYVYLSSKCLELLTNYLNWRQKHIKEGEQALFIGIRGKRINRWRVNHLLRELGRRCGIPILPTRKIRRGEKGIYLHPHLFRHTFATYAIAKGADLKEVQELLGHERISTTDEYVHGTKRSRETYDRIFG